MVRRKYLLLVMALLAIVLISSCGTDEHGGVASNPEAKASFEKGNAYYKLGNLDAAIKEYERTVLYDTKHKMAHYNLAVLYKEKGRYTEATHEFEEYMKNSHEVADKVVRSYVEDEIKKLKAK